MPNILKVVIVDDTITYRSILRQIVDNMPNSEVVATAPNGKIALSKLQEVAADIVLLDIEMPEMDGLETLAHIREKYPHLSTVMVSGLNRSSADITIRALEMGALDFIPKPEGESLKHSIEELQLKIAAVFKHIMTLDSKKSKPGIRAPLRPSSGAHETNSPASRTQVPSRKPKKLEVIAIGASTGGPNALAEILPKLPGDLGVPILLVQHMPPVFTASMASSLDRKCSLKVKEAADQEIVQPNTVYIAPGGHHMTVKRNKNNQVQIILNDEKPEHSCRPSVDVLFRSIAETYQHNILSIVLTGMGQDGALGVKALKRGGCYSLTQSEKSCVVYGMPQAVVKMDLSDEAVDLQDMAERIIKELK